MRSISARAWLLVVFSAGLQVFMFPTGGPMPLWRTVLCWFALVPFLVALNLPGKNGQPLSLRNALLLGYGCGFLWYFGNCFWIYQTMYLYGGLPKPVSFGIVVLFSLYLGLYHALFAGLYATVRRGRSGVTAALLLTPFLWVAVELARARITGFPWDLLGYVQVDHLLVTTIAPFAGVMGISFLIALVNASFAAAALQRSRRGALSALAIGLVALALQLSNYYSRLADRVRTQDARAVMLQENLGVGVAGRAERAESREERLQNFSDLSLNAIVAETGLEEQSGYSRGPLLERPTILLWPEAPSQLQSNDPSVRESLVELARKAHAPVIAGMLGVDADPESERGVRVYDSALALQADGTVAGRYDKIHLVPWGEYVPYKALFSFADKLTQGVGNMDRGHERTLFHLGNHQYGTFICYESIFGNEVREFAKNGADVLVNLSDDGWYGETGAPWQHLNMARMRAIENDRWVLRSTNTGVTTAIDPLGRLEGEAPRHVRGAFAFSFGFERKMTFYTLHGDWFAYLCVLVSFAGLAMGLRKGLRPR